MQHLLLTGNAHIVSFFIFLSATGHMLTVLSDTAMQLVTGSDASVFVRQRSESLKNSSLALLHALVIALVAAIWGWKDYTALLLFDRLVTALIQLVVTVVISELTKCNFLHFFLRMLQPH